jgi:glycerol transport system ATP-binding protein
VFQFPVVYDTMTVYDNLAFPLKNRGVAQGEIDKRVREIADMLDLTQTLHKRAAGLTADGKQKISLGRGLVRSDVNVIMFDEPLTVIDPHLKWVLRSKLKELHTRIRRTMIYVTHDQTEALTFADRVVVMNLGEVVQVGTPVELFERPAHTFVGHFIGSPGMNALPCALENGRPTFLGNTVPVASGIEVPHDGKLEIGIRPEFIKFNGSIGDTGPAIPVEITKVADAGRFRIVETRAKEHRIRLLVPEGDPIPSGAAQLKFDPKHTHLYRDGWLVG